MHLCSSSVIVSLEQNLKGGSFVEVAALERHNYEEEHINPPQFNTLSVFSSTHFPFLSFSLALISTVQFPSLILFFFISNSALILTCILLSHPVSPLIDSPGLTLSYLTTNEQSGCAHSQMNQEPTWEPFTLYHNTVLISLEANSFS